MTTVLDYRGKFSRRQITRNLINRTQSEVELFLASCGIDVHVFNQGRKGSLPLTRELLFDDVYLRFVNERIERVARTVTGFVILGKDDLICEAGRFTSAGEQTRGPQKKGLSETCRYGERDKKAFQRGVREEWGLKVPLKQILLLFDPVRNPEEIRRDHDFLTDGCGVSLEELMWRSNIHSSTAYHGLMTHNIITVVVLHLDRWPFLHDPHIVTDNETIIHVTKLSSLNPIPSLLENLLKQLEKQLQTGTHSPE